MSRPPVPSVTAAEFWEVAGDFGRCWEWTGTRNPQGYGRVKYAGRWEQAHRVAYAIAVGPIPDGLFVLHSCDNPPCCNPDHLRVGTHLDNMRDRVARGRHRGQNKLQQVSA